MARTVDPEKHRAKRQHILDSAAVLFAEQGYERTTTDQLCRQARISPGSLYHYFSGKKQVFLAVLTQDEQGSRSLLEELLDGSDPLEALMQFLGHLAEPAGAGPMVSQLVLEAMLQAFRDPEVSAELGRVDQDEQRGIRTLLQRAMDAGQVNSALDTDQTATWISTMIGAVFLGAALDPTFEPDQQIQQFTTTVRAYLQAGMPERDSP